MKFGFGLPNIGPLGSAESVQTVAVRAEELGYHSLWVVERLLYPVNPQTPYPVTPDGSLPEVYKHVLDGNYKDGLTNTDRSCKLLS